MVAVSGNFSLVSKACPKCGKGELGQSEVREK